MAETRRRASDVWVKFLSGGEAVNLDKRDSRSATCRTTDTTSEGSTSRRRTASQIVFPAGAEGATVTQLSTYVARRTARRNAPRKLIDGALARGGRPTARNSFTSTPGGSAGDGSVGVRMPSGGQHARTVVPLVGRHAHSLACLVGRRPVDLLHPQRGDAEHGALRRSTACGDPGGEPGGPVVTTSRRADHAPLPSRRRQRPRVQRKSRPAPSWRCGGCPAEGSRRFVVTTGVGRLRRGRGCRPDKRTLVAACLTRTGDR